MTTVLIFLGAYLALNLALMVAVRRYRVRLLTLACELFSDPKVHEDVRDLAHRISIYSNSMRVAPVNALWFATMLIKPSWRVHQEALDYAGEHPAIMAEGRLDELYDLYLVSTTAINPAFGAVALVLRALFRVKARAYARRRHTNAQRVLTYAQLQGQLYT